MKPVFHILALTVFLAGCSRKDTDPKLVIYAAGPKPLADVACEVFTRETGIPTELFTATTGQIMAKLEAEKYRPRADVVIFASRMAAEALKREGMLLPYRPLHIDDTDPDWHDPDHAYQSTAAAGIGVAFRKDTFVPGLRWSDFLDGTFPGRVMMPSPTRSGSAGDFLLTYLQNHPGQGLEAFLHARRLGVEITGANNQALTSLMIGAHQAVFAAADYLVFEKIAAGEPLIMAYPEGRAPLIFRPIVILATTRHPEEARKFVDLYFGDEVQEAVAAMHLLPARKSIAPSPERLAAPLQSVMEVDPVKALEDQRRILNQFQYQVERAVILP
jgi:iron(III) transport system substrate-binding protein